MLLSCVFSSRLYIEAVQFLFFYSYSRRELSVVAWVFLEFLQYYSSFLACYLSAPFPSEKEEDEGTAWRNQGMLWNLSIKCLLSSNHATKYNSRKITPTQLHFQLLEQGGTPPPIILFLSPCQQQNTYWAGVMSDKQTEFPDNAYKTFYCWKHLIDKYMLAKWLNRLD